MANQCNVIYLEEVSEQRPDGWKLCLQWCRYEYAHGSKEFGYRFIWRWPTSNKLQPARGQARLPSIAIILRLVEAACLAGWGDKLADDANDFKIEEEF